MLLFLQVRNLAQSWSTGRGLSGTKTDRIEEMSVSKFQSGNMIADSLAVTRRCGMRMKG